MLGYVAPKLCRLDKVSITLSGQLSTIGVFDPKGPQKPVHCMGKGADKRHTI